MDRELVERLLREGYSSRRIANEYGYTRHEVEALGREMVASRRRRRLVQAAVALAVIAAVGAATVTMRTLWRDSTDYELAINIVRAADALPAAPSENSWLIEKEVSGEEAILANAALASELTKRLNQVLADNANVPEVTELDKLFGGRLFPTIFTAMGGGTTMRTGRPGEMPDFDALAQDKLLEVVFYGRFAYRHPRIGERLLSYHPGWHAVVMAALRYSDPIWFDAVVAHEFWHAKQHREGVPGIVAPTLSDSWVEVELGAHRVGEKVLDARTSGAYRNRLAAVADRVRARTIRQFLSRIAPADLQELDGLFQPALPEERDTRAGQYLLNLAFVWLGRRYSGAELTEREIEAYRLLISPQSTGVR